MWKNRKHNEVNSKKGRDTPTKTTIKLSLSLHNPMMNYKYIVYFIKKLTKQDIS